MFLSYRVQRGFFTLLTGSLIYNSMFLGQTNITFEKIIGSKNYLTYVLLGIMAFSCIHGLITSVSRSIITEKRENTLISLQLTTVNKLEYFLGYFIFQIAIIILEIIIYIIIAKLFGVYFESINMLSIVYISLLTICGLYGLGIVLCWIMLEFNDTYIIQNTFIMIIMLISGLISPKEFLPYYFQVAGKFFPITYSFDLIRDILFGTKVGNWDMAILMNIGYIIIGVFFVIPLINKYIENHL